MRKLASHSTTLEEVNNMGKKIISDEIKEETLKRLNKHVEEKYIGQYDVKEVIAKFKGRYLYIEWVEGPSESELEALKSQMSSKLSPFDRILLEGIENMMKNQSKPSKLCRLKYIGDINHYEFEIFKYSDNWYDTEGEFPFGGGTVEECFDAAASLYITQTFP